MPCASGCVSVTAVIYWACTFFSFIFTELLLGTCSPHFYWWGSGGQDLLRVTQIPLVPCPLLLIPCDAAVLACGLVLGSCLTMVIIPCGCPCALFCLFFAEHDISAFCILKQFVNLCRVWLSLHQTVVLWLTDMHPWVGNVGCFLFFLPQIM